MKVIQIPPYHFVISARDGAMDSQCALDFLSNYAVTVVQETDQWRVTLDEYSHDLIMEIMRGCRNCLDSKEYRIVGFASAGVVGV